MTFREYYLEMKKQERPPHPAKVFLQKIADLTGRSPKTVSQWLSGSQVPPREICIQIGDLLEVNPDDLFP